MHEATRLATVVVTRGGTELTRWDVLRSGAVDLSLVDQVARLRLHARGMGFELHVHDPCPRVRDLLVLAGLGDLLDDGNGSTTG